MVITVLSKAGKIRWRLSQTRICLMKMNKGNVKIFNLGVLAWGQKIFIFILFKSFFCVNYNFFFAFTWLMTTIARGMCTFKHVHSQAHILQVLYICNWLASVFFLFFFKEAIPGKELKVCDTPYPLNRHSHCSSVSLETVGKCSIRLLMVNSICYVKRFSFTLTGHDVIGPKE